MATTTRCAGCELEGKAMSTAVAGDGGYLVDPQTAETDPQRAEIDRLDPPDRQRGERRGDVL